MNWDWVAERGEVRKGGTEVEKEAGRDIKPKVGI